MKRISVLVLACVIGLFSTEVFAEDSNEDSVYEPVPAMIRRTFNGSGLAMASRR